MIRNSKSTLVEINQIAWTEVCEVIDIPEDGGGCALVNGEQIAIFNFSRRNEWYATQNLCPHKQQMALSRGMIGTLQDEPKVACPFHKKNFSLKTGECLSGDDYQIKTYPIKIENDKIFIGI
ncbi:MAG: nitrite reductase small subunit NirD [Cytophagales bacterium]